MRSNTGSPGFVGKTNGLCQSPSFLDQEDRGSGYEIGCELRYTTEIQQNI